MYEQKREYLLKAFKKGVFFGKIEIEIKLVKVSDYNGKDYIDRQSKRWRW